MNTVTLSQTLAASTSASWLFVIVGVLVVAVLIAAFWYGSRRAARRPMPPQEPQPRADSWQTPDTPDAPPGQGPPGQGPEAPEHDHHI
ncbi:hypothetical protein A8W25_00825 [Streptomyces sp. ERV7]|uniref:DUF6479 family protein n=1 Tax=Streptomyces sp. ERV7 TaxID=1322334 RepID=UPI0007F33A32|nr:DUF6479 family protein [Streptomyces sp. ERV7]OAR26876.1 hypothetical protein A8W25_00825 [Streptomyces sp. ERV7]